MPSFTTPIHEYNQCHAPDSGRFCSTPGGVKAFLKVLDIKQLPVSSNSFWSYVDTPKGRAGLHINDLYTLKDDRVELHWLTAEKRGSGRAAMEQIVKAADEYGITLQLWPTPLEGIGDNEGFQPSAAQLRRFYADFGFTVERWEYPRRKDKGAPLLVRKPRA